MSAAGPGLSRPCIQLLIRAWDALVPLLGLSRDHHYTGGPAANERRFATRAPRLTGGGSGAGS
jgi:hypothetical protein